jgi:hypothetical protein
MQQSYATITSPTAAELRDVIKYSPRGLITHKNIHAGLAYTVKFL